MKTKVSISATAVLALVGIVLAIYLYEKYKGPALTLVTKTLNPASTGNIVYTTLSSQTSSKSVGTSLYDWLHPTYDPNNPATASGSWWTYLKSKL